MYQFNRYSAVIAVILSFMILIVSRLIFLIDTSVVKPVQWLSYFVWLCFFVVFAFAAFHEFVSETVKYEACLLLL